MSEKIEITGLPIDNITMEQAVMKVREFLESGKVNTIYTPNSEIMMAAYRDKNLRKVLSEADMLIADGAGVVLASRILGRKLPEKVSGIDLARRMFALEREGGTKFYFLGGKPGVAEEAAEKIKQQYPGVHIVGTRHGYFKPEEEPAIVDEINSSGAEVLLVALGAPKQEYWIDKYKHALRVKICMGVGGSLDIFSGRSKLAPEFMRKHGLEWLYRLCREPRRYKRMLDLPRYMMLVLAIRLGIKR